MKAAGVYAKLGWPVVPLHSALGGVCSCPKGSACPSAGKHPRLPDWTAAASSDPATVAEWAHRWPSGNVGVATGRAFWVLDVDPDNDGDATLEILTLEHGDLPRTVEAETGSGGRHYLFTLPRFPVKNTAGKLGPGLDTRGEGGQIVVAPSVSAKGAYRWVHPPWSTPLADAPAWLLELLQAQAPARASSGPSSAPRVQFPPASPEVLDRARQALEEHGPAVEGQGGDAHTFVAAAVLVHDFALTEEEAWPLFLEWNDLCSPPWGEGELAAKLRGGAKYGTRPYGCRRGADALEVIRAILGEWQQGASGAAGMIAMLDRVRPLLAAVSNRVQHSVICRELRAATGLSAKEAALPPPALVPEDIPAGAIVLTPRVHEVADAATKLIAPHVYARAGVLCEVVKAERTFLSDLEVPRLVDLMSETGKWGRVSEEGIFTVQAPPEPIARILAARRNHKGIRVIEGVTTAPVFLANGSILQTRGYSAAARLFLEPSVAVDVPDEPTPADARAAVALFRDLLSDFRFAGPGDFSSWLAGVLSCLVKPATGNAPGPLVCVSASSPGAGKSLLTGIASRIIAGAPPEIRPYNPRDPGEWGKRITAFVRAGTPISVFDNVNGPFGDETIDRLVTSSTWSDRVLGASEAPPIPIVTTWWATGNNIEPQGDTVRRVLVVRIEVDTERPQERTGFARPNILRDALEHRAAYLSAALTILRAYHVAGRPPQNLPAWGSFEAWSDLVRGALVWCGEADPFVTQRRAAAELNEPDNDAHDFWIATVEGTDGSPGTIAAAANARGVSELLGVRESITAHALRKFLRRFIDKPRQGLRIRRDAGRYYVERIKTPA